MDTSKSLESNLDKLKGMTIELPNSGGDLSDENQAIILLSSIHEVFWEVKNVFPYKRYRLKFDTVLSSLGTRDVELEQENKELGRTNKRDSGQRGSLFTCGSSNERESDTKFKKKGISQSKERSKSKRKST